MSVDMTHWVEMSQLLQDPSEMGDVPDKYSCLAFVVRGKTLIFQAPTGFSTLSFSDMRDVAEQMILNHCTDKVMHHFATTTEIEVMLVTDRTEPVGEENSSFHVILDPKERGWVGTSRFKVLQPGEELSENHVLVVVNYGTGDQPGTNDGGGKMFVSADKQFSSLHTFEHFAICQEVVDVLPGNRQVNSIDTYECWEHYRAQLLNAEVSAFDIFMQIYNATDVISPENIVITERWLSDVNLQGLSYKKLAPKAGEFCKYEMVGRTARFLFLGLPDDMTAVLFAYKDSGNGYWEVKAWLPEHLHSLLNFTRGDLKPEHMARLVNRNDHTDNLGNRMMYSLFVHSGYHPRNENRLKVEECTVLGQIFGHVNDRRLQIPTLEPERVLLSVITDQGLMVGIDVPKLFLRIDKKEQWTVVNACITRFAEYGLPVRYAVFMK